MLCHCARLTDPHEHSPQACTSPVPVTKCGLPIETESLSAMSVRHMQEQVAEEASWAEKLRPQIERELRRRIADEVEHDHVRGLEALRNLHVIGLANGTDKQILDMLAAIILHVEHWLCGIRDGSVGRKP